MTKTKRAACICVDPVDVDKIKININGAYMIYDLCFVS